MGVDSNRYGLVEDISRILRILEDQDGEGSGVTAIARAIDVSPSKASRLLQTLQGEGLVNRDLETGKYRLGPRLTQLGLAQLLSEPLRPLLLPHLEQMARDSGRMTSWGTGSQAAGMAITVDRIATSTTGHLVHLMGAMIPYFASSYGRVFMAYMDEERRTKLLSNSRLVAHTSITITGIDELRRSIEQISAQGYATDDGEAVENLRAVSVPIFDRGCKLCAVINLSGYDEWTVDHKAYLVNYLVNKGCFISRQLGYQCQ